MCKKIWKEYSFWGLEQDWKVVPRLKWTCFPKATSQSHGLTRSRWFGSLWITKVKFWVVTILELNGRNLALRGSLSLNATFLGTLLLVVNANIMFIEKKIFFFFVIRYQISSFILKHYLNCCLTWVVKNPMV
jgi:hypothetical protein